MREKVISPRFYDTQTRKGWFELSRAIEKVAVEDSPPLDQNRLQSTECLLSVLYSFQVDRMYSMFSPPSCDHQTTNIFRSPPVPSSASFNIQVLLSNGIKRSATRELVFSNQKSTKSNSTPQLPFKIKKEDGKRYKAHNLNLSY